MHIYTDKPEFAEQYLSKKLDWKVISPCSLENEIAPLVSLLFTQDKIYQATFKTEQMWRNLLLVEYAAESQFDILASLAQQGSNLPDGILCVAGSGKKFHGFKNRPWMSLAGNIHLCAYFAPEREIEHFSVAFTILSAVSVLQVLDSIRGMENRAKVKWINDILIGNAKVCGVLARTQSRGNIVTAAILGIGLNVEKKPVVEPTPFVPEVTALREFNQDQKYCNQSIVFQRLIHQLEHNYQRLLAGNYSQLLQYYREKSLVVGKQVRVFTDAPAKQMKEMVHGKVRAIGENLELTFENMVEPVTKGRLVLET